MSSISVEAAEALLAEAKAAHDPDREEREKHLLAKGWKHQTDGKWYDANPPKPQKVVIGERKHNGQKVVLEQVHGESAPWAYTFKDAWQVQMSREERFVDYDNRRSAIDTGDIVPG